MTETKQALRVHITGRVQGVGFRAWTQAEAEKLGLRGWVRNEGDGSVRALVVGPDAAVAAMLLLLREGPRGAVVADVVSEAAEPEFMLTTFFSFATAATASPTPELARSTKASTFSTSIH